MCIDKDNQIEPYTLLIKMNVLQVISETLFEDTIKMNLAYTESITVFFKRNGDPKNLISQHEPTG